MTSPLLALAPAIRARQAPFCAWVGLRDPIIPESLARDGFDFIVLDWQHGFQNNESVVAGIGAAAIAGKAAMVRIGVGDFAGASRFLDFGAAGIIAPMVNSAADAKAFAAAMKYPPMGERSWGPARALGLSGLTLQQNLEQANGHTLAIAMIETRAAIAAVDDILAVPGIDGVFAGPSDLSVTLSNGAHIDHAHPDVAKAIDHIIARAQAHNKLAGAFCMSGERAADHFRRGCHFTTIANDAILLRAGAKAELDKARGGVSGPVKGGY